jgi:hypothetical protein
MFAEGYQKHLMGKGKMGKARGRAVKLRPQTPHSTMLGGGIGMHPGGMAMSEPRNMGPAMHPGANMPGRVARTTGYGAPGHQPAAASPNMGFVVGGKGRGMRG